MKTHIKISSYDDVFNDVCLPSITGGVVRNETCAHIKNWVSFPRQSAGAP